VFDLNNPDDLDSYESHPGKLLFVHTDGVQSRVKARIGLKIAHVAALLHDVGKINPNFQHRLYNRASSDAYTRHAYLSAMAFLSLPDRLKARHFGPISKPQIFSIAMLIARHHGNLRNCARAGQTSSKLMAALEIELTEVLSQQEYEALQNFLRKHPNLPVAPFVSRLLGSNVDFKLMPNNGVKPSLLLNLKVEDALHFFMDTQFAFAALIESDKRDASNNEEERRAKGVAQLSSMLTEKLNTLPAIDADVENEKKRLLNRVRTQIREEALRSLQQILETGDKRVFCLTSPTGSGKTLTLMALANAILQHRIQAEKTAPALRGIIYCLPFLSITEQVETVCSKLVDNSLVLRADSRAHHPNIEQLLKDADSDPTAGEQLLREDFAELIFDCPLVITTFVQFFETLMSHRNATLLKLPNFARSIILIDEVQALPPRLYVFFAAYLDVFCRKFDSYVILSTATMPDLALPKSNQLRPEILFPQYEEPIQLIDERYLQEKCFNRYTIEPHWEISSFDTLAASVKEKFNQGKSIMVVLNTIGDTRQFYNNLNPNQDNPDIMLLNTRFMLKDRREKIARCSNLQASNPIVLITTQLVEAGVDIDFPVVYRDLCPLPNLVQTAGRCNRHDTLPEPGLVILFDLKDERGKSRAATIYLADIDEWYLNFTRKNITEDLRERQLSGIHQAFSREVNNNLLMGKHPGLRKGSKQEEFEKSNLMLCIRDAAFEDAGKFRLIQEEGEQFAFYVPESDQDNAFETLETFANELKELKNRRNFKDTMLKRIEVEAHMRHMGERIVQARIKSAEAHQLGPGQPVMGIYKLSDSRNYTPHFGLKVASDANFI
jgi:CRISPR-associated endonuclease/helicase Cas3